MRRATWAYITKLQDADNGFYSSDFTAVTGRTLLNRPVVIVEDEIPALEKLERYILKYDNTINILAKLTSIQDNVTWLQSHKDSIYMLFLDIQLSDVLSF